MKKRTALIYWSCVVGVQLAGLVMDSIGGNLDSIRLFGLLLLGPGISYVRVTVSTTDAQYYRMLGVAIAINLLIAGLIHLAVAVGRKLTSRKHI
jgi:hypothetical protein